MADAAPCAVIVLAAGGSSRMGRPKQLLDVEGQPLLRRAVGTALEARLGPVLVVLGAGAAEVRPAIAGLDIHVVENPGWQEGLSSSLRAGVEAAGLVAPAVRGLIAMPADMPRITALHLRALDARQRALGAAIVATDDGDHRGPPAFFARAVFAALAALRGDAGARGLLGGHGVVTVAATSGAGIDIDSPEDLQRFRDV